MTLLITDQLYQKNFVYQMLYTDIYWNYVSLISNLMNQ